MALQSDSLSEQQLFDYGINFVRTDMTQGNRSAAEWEAIERSVAERTMLGRIGQPEDIANAVAFIAAPESGWVTAQMLVVDGGRMDYIGHG